MKQPTAGTLATITCIECGRQARSGELWRLYYADIGEALATITCIECGRQARSGALWRLYYADIGEAVTYCPECAKREFGEVSGQPWRCALAESAV